MTNQILLHPNRIEKAKRRAQAMMFEAFSGVNGVEYCNCRDIKLDSNRIYVSMKDIDAIKHFEDSHYNSVDLQVFDESFFKKFETMTEQQYINFAHGSLYLPFPYIPSTSLSDDRFGNELYYWDSYLYVLCLLSFDQIQDAMGIIRNFCYELTHYHMILNGNRTYYLGRSQPPFLSSMVMAVYDYLTNKNFDQARAWLQEMRNYLVMEFEVWEKYGFQTIEHNGKQFRLATYFDRYNFLCPEAFDEKEYPECVLGLGYEDISSKHQDFFLHINGRWYFKEKPNTSNSELLKRWEHSKQSITTNRANSSAERASGIDTSEVAWENRCSEIFPICLNSLLWKLVSDLNKIATVLNDYADRYLWREKKSELHDSIQNYLWNEDVGVYQNRYSDGNFTRDPFITTIYPMMFGLASRDRAKRIATYTLNNFRTPYGIKNTKTPQNCQWDHIWPIGAYFSNKAFRMYKNIKIDEFFLDEWAENISISFINNVVDNYSQFGTFFEKFNGYDGTPNFQHIGYKNQPEFVWTAAALLTLLHRL